MKDFCSGSAYRVCVQNRVEMLVYLVNIFWREGLYTWQTVVGVCGIEGVVRQLLENYRNAPDGFFSYLFKLWLCNISGQLSKMSDQVLSHEKF